MLGGYWLLIAFLLLVFSLIFQQVSLLLVLMLFLVAVGVSKLWGRYCLTRVEYCRRLSTNCVFFGEDIQLEVEIGNRKALPLPWIQVDDEVPEELELVRGKTTPSHRETRLLIKNLLSMSWYHRIKRRYLIHCSHRGYFAFGPAVIRSGDLFGLVNQQTEEQTIDYLMVYPKILPLDQLGIPSMQPMGEIRTRNYLFQDPVLTMGVREYQSGDSLKRIDWKSTARSGQLKTRIYQPTTTIDVGIFLDVRTVPPPMWGSLPQLFELVVIVAASIANHAMTKGYRVGLYANQNYWSGKELIRIPPSQHPDQMRYILEALAQVYPTETVSIGRMVLSEARNYSWGSTIVVISAAPTNALLTTLLSIKRAGRKVALVRVGEEGSSISTNGLPVYQVSEDIAWRELGSVHIDSC